jgi:hypothetical protein
VKKSWCLFVLKRRNCQIAEIGQKLLLLDQSDHNCPSVFLEFIYPCSNDSSIITHHRRQQSAINYTVCVTDERSMPADAYLKNYFTALKNADSLTVYNQYSICTSVSAQQTEQRVVSGKWYRCGKMVTIITASDNSKGTDHQLLL